MTEAQKIRAQAWRDKLANVGQLFGDIGAGAIDTTATLASGMGTSALAGLGGLRELGRLDSSSWNERKDRGVKRIADTMERYTRAPRTDAGERGVENIGDVFEHVGDAVNKMYLNPLAEQGGIGPELATAAVVAGNMVGPKGAKAPKVKPKPTPHTPRFDPGSPQQLIPGVEPLSLDQAHGIAQDRYQQALRDMSFTDRNRALRFEYDPEWTGSQLGSSEMQPGAWDVDYKTLERGGERYSQGKRPAREVRGSRVFRRTLEEEGAAPMAEQGDWIHGATPRAEVGAENFQQMLARLERLQGTEAEAMQRGEEAALTRARNINQGIARRRALLAEPDINADQVRQLNEEILMAKRNRPIEVADERTRIAIPHPGEGLMSPIEWRDLLGHSTLPRQSEMSALQNQYALVRRLRGEPEYTPTTPRTTPHNRTTLSDVEGRDPNAMNRQAVNEFLAGGRGNESLFQYGTMPGPEVQSLDDFARHFAKKSGEDYIDVNWSHADGGGSDEPYKIKVRKEHGRGEVMRDSHGDYIDRMKEYERGDYPMYDERGDVKKVETPGPLPEGEEGPLLKKQRAEGGETMRDSYGDPKYEFQKSEGGEPVYDERGRPKYTEEENPDYRESSEVDEATLQSPKGEISIRYDDPAYITATEAGGKGGGQLLYQTALAHASRAGIDIGGSGLTSINAYRLLSNVLSNIARSGKNPRDVGGTSSGRAARARGQAQGPEVWRAEAEEGRSRLLQAGADPDRVRFDPEKGFTIDGSPAGPDDVKMKLNELSPNAGRGQSTGGVGQKSLMRNAVFEWLRNATPEQAKAVAAKWPKEWGPIFAGIGALGVGMSAMQEEPQTTD